MWSKLKKVIQKKMNIACFSKWHFKTFAYMVERIVLHPHGNSWTNTWLKRPKSVIKCSTSFKCLVYTAIFDGHAQTCQAFWIWERASWNIWRQECTMWYTISTNIYTYGPTKNNINRTWSAILPFPKIVLSNNAFPSPDSLSYQECALYELHLSWLYL